MYSTATADFLVRERLRDLQTQIDKLHLNYLQTDQSPNKIEQRAKLESYIKELISLVPHEYKFYLPATSEVLHQSASRLEGFSAYGAASAWNAIANYAANLLAQPWRKEFRELKLYCGFYKHEIEANLLGAQVLLEAMGYKSTDEASMVLDGPIDPDRISCVSRDALVAYVECQLLKTVWEEVSQRIECPWYEVVTFREKHVGSADHAARGLMYQLHQRQFLSRQYMTQQQQQTAHQSPHQHQRTLPAGYTLPSYGHGYYGYGGYYTLPTVPPAPPPPPPPAMASIYAAPHPQPMYAYPAPASYNMPAPINGYVPNSSAVPTAQLIELASAGPNSPPPPPPSSTKPNLKPPAEPPARPPAEEGSGTFGSWDYVYRNLESQGYNKDIGERPDLTSRTASTTATSISVLTPTTSTPTQPPAINTTISNYTTTTTTTISSPITQDSTRPMPKTTTTNVLDDTLTSLRLDQIRVPSPTPAASIWQCITCTFANDNKREICEMCGKSKTRGAESQPLASGGRECPSCTLVNPKGVTKCEACEHSLEDSPTYI